MTVTTTGPGPSRLTPLRRLSGVRRNLTDRRLRFSLLAATLAIIVCGMLFALHAASYGDLTSGIRAGSISDVTVWGALPANAVGDTTARIEWRQDGTNRYVEVQQFSSAAEQAQDQSSLGDGSMPVVVGDLVGQLRALNPAVTINNHPNATPDTGVTTRFYGWQLPSWLGACAFVVAVLSLALLIGGREPLWGTRWAWWWIGLLVGPAIIPAFLALSGSAPGVAESTSRGRRLTGGWAFLLLVALGAGTHLRGW